MDGYSPATSSFARGPSATQTISFPALACASLLASLWLIAIDPVINDEAVIVLRAADTYISSGFAASVDLFERPLLPIAIATIHQLTGVSLVVAAHSLTTGLFILLCQAFVSTVAMLGGSRQAQLFAAILVLLHPLLCSFRSDFFTEPGYWAFMLLALCPPI